MWHAEHAQRAGAAGSAAEIAVASAGCAVSSPSSFRLCDHQSAVHASASTSLETVSLTAGTGTWRPCGALRCHLKPAQARGTHRSRRRLGAAATVTAMPGRPWSRSFTYRKIVSGVWVVSSTWVWLTLSAPTGTMLHPTDATFLVGGCTFAQVATWYHSGTCARAPSWAPVAQVPQLLAGPCQQPREGDRRFISLAAPCGLAVATGPFKIRWSTQLPSAPTHTGSNTDTHGVPHAAAGAATPGPQGLRQTTGAPAGPPLAAVRAPRGIWTSLKLQQLPQVAAHAVRLEAMRRALDRVAAAQAVAEEPGAWDGETWTGRSQHGGGGRSQSCAGLELEHVR